MSPKNTIAFITDSNFEKLLDRFAEDGKVYTPQAVLDREGVPRYPYELRSADKPFSYFGYRPVQPLKTFLFSCRLKVAEYPAKEGKEPPPSTEKVFVVGAAACDIVSLKSLDAVFLQEEFTDIFYSARRENTFIVTADCTEPRENCFCTLADHGPFPKEGFDLNLSRVEDGYIIEAGSVKGEKVITDNSQFFSDAGKDRLSARDGKRSETVSKVEEQNKEFELSKNRQSICEIQRESEDWFEHVKNCVECGACLFSCPTCHCFLLYDQAGTEGKFQRIKEWDVCVYGGFSRMSGGSSPRLGLMERFRHRYLHKFEYYPKNFDFEACTGCGRCIEGCMGKIDMRKVLKALDTETIGAGK